MAGDEQNLSARTLLRAACRRLTRQRGTKDLHFGEHGVLAEIADDSDWHRTRTGYMLYRSAKIVDIGGRRWAIARGESSGDYPARPFDSDIVAVSVPPGRKVDARLKAEVMEAIRRSSYFRSSLVVAMADGNLVVYGRSVFGQAVKAGLEPVAADLVARGIERNDDCIDPGTMRAVVTSSAAYKPTAPRRLAAVIREALTASKHLDI